MDDNDNNDNDDDRTDYFTPLRMRARGKKIVSVIVGTHISYMCNTFSYLLLFVTLRVIITGLFLSMIMICFSAESRLQRYHSCLKELVPRNFEALELH